MQRATMAGLAGIALTLTGCTTAAVTSGSVVTTTTAAGSAAASAATPKGTYPVGATVKVPVTISGIDSVTLTQVYPNVSSSNQYESPDPGTTWFAADVTECAGPKGSNTGANPYDFAVLLSNGSTGQRAIASGPLVGPLSTLNSVGGTNSLSPGQCDRGCVLWSIPTGVTPKAVQFSGTTESFSEGNSVVKWVEGG